MNKKEVLVQARALIADPRHWTQNAEARNMSGAQVSPHNVTAEKFCMLGAIRKACGNNGALFNETCEFARSILDAQLMHVNDSNSHEGMLSELDNVISEADKCTG